METKFKIGNWVTEKINPVNKMLITELGEKYENLPFGVKRNVPLHNGLYLCKWHENGEEKSKAFKEVDLQLWND